MRQYQNRYRKTAKKHRAARRVSDGWRSAVIFCKKCLQSVQGFVIISEIPMEARKRAGHRVRPTPYAPVTSSPVKRNTQSPRNEFPAPRLYYTGLHDFFQVGAYSFRSVFSDGASAGANIPCFPETSSSHLQIRTAVISSRSGTQ